MGTFERIRKVSPYAFAAFVIIFVGFMILSDADISTVLQQGSNPQTAALAEINGEKILYKDYEAKVRQMVEQQRAQSQDPNQEIDENAIRNQVWEQMVEEMLLRQEAKKMGIVVTNDEVAEALLLNPPEAFRRAFSDTAGRFNVRLYHKLVTNPEEIVNYMGADPAKIAPEEKQKAIDNFRNELISIGDQLRLQKLAQGVMTTVGASSSLISPSFAKTKYIGENSNAEVNYIHFSINEIDPNSIKVSDSEIQKYYEAHKQSFKQKDERKIKFVSFQIEPSADDSARANRKIGKILEDLQKGTYTEMTDSIYSVKMNEFGGKTNDWTMVQDIEPFKLAYFTNAPEKQVIGPVRLPDGTYFFRLDARRSGTNEVVKASHILINAGTNKDSAKAEAMKVLARVKGGEDFATVAAAVSDDKGSAAQGGDLGFFGKGKMVKEFEDAAFSTPVGQVSGLVETQFGYHIIKVTDKKSEELQYSEIKITPTISAATKNKVFRDAAALAQQTKEGADFETVAKRLKCTPVESPFFDKQRPVMNSRAFTNAIFEADLGTVLEPRDLKDYGVVVARVVDEHKAGLAEMKDVRDEIKAKLVKIKRLDALKAKAQNAYNEVKSMGNMASVTNYPVRLATVKNNGLVQELGQDFVFTASVFKAKQGELVGPVRGELGYYIIQVNTQSVPDDQTVANNIKDYTKQISMQAKQGAFYQWFQHVKETAKIDDMRSKFYQEY